MLLLCRHEQSNTAHTIISCIRGKKRVREKREDTGSHRDTVRNPEPD